ncbi:MAG: (2Fe-2S)-binding protein [Kosmotogaceae bacterium]
MKRLTKHPILSFKRGKKITFYFEGRELTAYEGETIAVALHANGIRDLRKTPKKERSQGFFCAIGKCSSCLMVVNGVPNVRTCIICVKEGMSVRRQRGRGEILD